MTDPSILQQRHSATLRVVWAEPEGAAQPCNQFAVTVGLPTQSGMPEAVYLTLGSVEPPLLFGTEADVKQQLESTGGTLTVRPLGRYVFTRGRLDELIAVLQSAANAFDQAQEGAT
ncbi:hypothetical protein [Streptomyces sp. NRRL S-646]|uniref:hypothetical protein n=1 Tax=Streptomyces sp. NRRL S-646 TaxID=1463917 RepID=UPI0004CB1764|nr:hypothetical protein [Streptomyces sp. NRRL S-646]